MRTPAALLAISILLLACPPPTPPVEEAPSHPSGLRFPDRLGELTRIDDRPGKTREGIDVTYGRTKDEGGGLICRVTLDPVIAAPGAPEDVLIAEQRTSYKRHYVSLIEGRAEPFASEHPFRGATLHGSGVVTKRTNHSEVWESSLTTYVVDGWNVTFVVLERNADGSRPPLSAVTCASAFFSENGP
jgi:hypothetical protein